MLFFFEKNFVLWQSASLFGRTCSVPLEQLGQGSDVRLRHLKRLEFAQLSVAAQRGDDLSEPLKGVVQTVHPAALPRVGRQPTLLDHLDGGNFVGSPPTAPAAPARLGRPRSPRFPLPLAFGRRLLRRRSRRFVRPHQSAVAAKLVAARLVVVRHQRAGHLGGRMQSPAAVIRRSAGCYPKRIMAL